MLKTAVVGCGKIAKSKHIPILHKISDLVAVCDLDTNSLNHINHPARKYLDLDMMLTKEYLDVISVCTPPKTHRSVAEKILDSRFVKGVIVEKPVSLSTMDCAEMLEQARNKNVKICPIHSSQFYPGMMKLKKSYREGRLGNCLRLSLNICAAKRGIMSAKWINELPGGVLGEVGPHFAYLVAPFLEGEIKHIRVDATIPDEYSVVIKTDKTVVTGGMSLRYPGWRVMMEFFGSKAFVGLDVLGQIAVFHRLREPNKSYLVKDYFSSLWQTAYILPKNIYTYATKNYGHQLLISMFLKAIETGGEPPISDGETLKVVELTERMVKSVEV